MAKYDIEWTEPAIETLNLQYSFIQQGWSNTIADNFFEVVDQKLALIADRIYGGIPLTGNKKKVILHKNCTPYFEIEGGTILVLLVWDNRQDSNLLKEILM